MSGERPVSGTRAAARTGSGHRHRLGVRSVLVLGLASAASVSAGMQLNVGCSAGLIACAATAPDSAAGRPVKPRRWRCCDMRGPSFTG